VSIPEVPFRPWTVFIAEDHLIIRDVLIQQLQRSPRFTVLGSATDGKDAAKQCELLRPDLLVLDLELPLLSGIELAHHVHLTSPATEMLVFTGTAKPSLLQAVIAAGVRGIVRKTQKPEQLFAAMEEAASGRPVFDEEFLRYIQETKTQCSLADLTLREREVFYMVAQGRSNKEVAGELAISVKTAENHRKNLMGKLGAQNASDLTREAYRLGILG